jgi:hypothetical protein
LKGRIFPEIAKLQSAQAFFLDPHSAVSGEELLSKGYLLMAGNNQWLTLLYRHISN